MEFFENAVTKAKEAFDVACKKTGEMVSVGKQKFDIASIEAKLSKDFENLGKLYYNNLKETEIEDDEIKKIVKSIKSRETKIKNLREEINSTKNKSACPKCGALVDTLSIYCNICGERLVNEDE